MIPTDNFVLAPREDIDALNAVKGKIEGPWALSSHRDFDTNELTILIEGDNAPVQAWLRVIMPIAQYQKEVRNE